jgi:excinuclease UvrABC helicase subunit UvrB
MKAIEQIKKELKDLEKELKRQKKIEEYIRIKLTKNK